MHIRRLRLSNFRCFADKEFDFDGKFVVVKGKNGSGKSSLLEALFYCCYLKSFRTHLNRELVKLDQDYFFIEIEIDEKGCSNRIQVGFNDDQGKVVKYNQKQIASYRELISQFRVISVCADDLVIVSGSPEYRRDLLNYSTLLLNPSLYPMFKRYRQILEQRNSLLKQCKFTSKAILKDELLIWSEKLWMGAIEIGKIRLEYLKNLELKVNNLIREYFATGLPDLSIEFSYMRKNGVDEEKTFNQFWQEFSLKDSSRLEHELGRSFYGAHLDDFGINFYGRKAKIYASRGQQKLIVFLMKVAQLDFMRESGFPGVLLLDDFLTDFDQKNVKLGLNLLKNRDFQVFLTSPIPIDFFDLKSAFLVEI